tara:strand:+ start:373 stop:969 length:597 start_codon:yes stop_codon:yes gene_type:complete
MGIATILRLLLRAGKAKKAAKVFRSAKKLPKVPQKSKDMPGVVKRNLPGNKGLGYASDSPFGFNPLKRQIAERLSRRPKYKVGSDKWKRQVSDDVREFTRKHGLGPKGKWRETSRLRNRGLTDRFRRPPLEPAVTRGHLKLKEFIEKNPLPRKREEKLFNDYLIKRREALSRFRAKKKPTVWDQMRAMSDEFDDFPID